MAAETASRARRLRARAALLTLVVVAAGLGLAWSLEGRRGPSHPYFPLRLGDAWDYSDGAEHVVSIGLRDGRTTARLATADAALGTGEKTIVVTHEGVLPEFEIILPSGTSRTTGATGMYLPARLVPGVSWTYTQEWDLPLSKMTIKVEARAAERERVTVPAGSFDAIRVEADVESHTVAKAGDAPAFDHRQRDSLWFAEGVGLVRRVGVGETGHRTERVLTRFQPGAGP